MNAALFIELVHHGAVLDVDFAVDILTLRIVFTLLRHIQIHCVVVSCELVAFEKLDCCLVQLEHDDLVQQFKALDVALVDIDAVRQFSDPRNL